MFNRRLIRLIAAGLAVMMTTVVCITSSGEDAEEEEEKRGDFVGEQLIIIQREATGTAAAALTQTAQALITPTITPTPSPTPIPFILPDPAFSYPGGPPNVTVTCINGDETTDPDITVVDMVFFDPTFLGPDQVGWAVQMVGTPLNTTFPDEHAFSMKVLVQVVGESEQVGMTIEGHVDNAKKGVCTNPDCTDIIPGTEGRLYTDEQGKVWMLLPSGARQMTVALTHGLNCFNIGWFTFDLYVP